MYVHLSVYMSYILIEFVPAPPTLSLRDGFGAKWGGWGGGEKRRGGLKGSRAQNLKEYH